MNFLKYSNETQSNIIPKAEFDGLVSETFGIIADNITKSLGPLGSSATILDGMMTESTKDGFSILMKYCFHNRYKKMIYNLIKAPCIKMNNTVGDGTTTAIALTNALFNRYKSNKSALETLYRLPRTFIDTWDSTIEDITKRIREMSKGIDPEDYDTIYNISYVTSNGNHEISKNIAKAYSEMRSPSIKQKDSPTNKSYIEAIEGFEFPANLIDTIFVRNQDLTAEEKDIAIMIFDHKIDTDTFMNVITKVNDVYRAASTKLLIIAPSYDALTCDTVIEQYIKAQYAQYGRINLILSQYNESKLTPYQLSDLSVVLKCKVITQNIVNAITLMMVKHSIDEIVDRATSGDETYELNGIIGSANTAMLSCNNGSIFKLDGVEYTERYKQTLEHARKELEDIKNKTDYEKLSFSAKVHEANSRVLQLEMKNYIYYIGADSALQKQIIWDSVEDTIKCVRSAVKYGVVPGCQLSIIKACVDMAIEFEKKFPDFKDPKNPTVEEIESIPVDIRLRNLIVTMIYNACIDVYALVLMGPEKDGILKMIPGWQYMVDKQSEELKRLTNEKFQQIMEESFEKYQVFDLETLDFNPNIITSAETDEMVLLSVSELIKILISGNQCIFLDSEINDSHQEQAEIYM